MKFFSKTIKNKKLLISVFLFLLIISFFFVSPVYASAIGDFVTSLIGWIFAAFISMLGVVLMLIVHVLVYLAQFNNFLGVDAVTRGWAMVRDLANMFFIVILLIIAFATILGIEKYNYKKWLPKLILMAVLINFSKMICGLLIDVAQVVMLSFVNSFKTIGGTNIVHMLGITEWQKFRGGGTMDELGVSNWEILGAYALAAIYVVISIVVIGTMMLVLAMRIIMIWIYVILSPLAFLMQSFPGGQGYAGKWWTQFTQNLVVGPVLAFFIWLSFSVVTFDVTGTKVLGDNQPPLDPSGDMSEDGFGKGDLMIQFIVSIGLLIGGLKVSQEIGGAAGSIAGKGMARLNKMSVGAQNFAKRKSLDAAKSTGKFIGREALGRVVSPLAQMAPEGSKLKTRGDLGQAWRKDIKASRKKSKVEKRQKFLKSMGMGEGFGHLASSKLKESGKHKKYETMYRATEEMGRKPEVARKLAKHFENPRHVQDFSSSDLHTLGGGVNKDNAEAIFNNPEAIKTFEQWFKGEGGYSKGGDLEALAYSGDAKDLSKARAWKAGIKDAEEKGVKGVENAKGIMSTLDDLKLDTAIPIKVFKKIDNDTSVTKTKNVKKSQILTSQQKASKENISFNSSQLEELMDNFSKKLEEGLSGLSGKGGKGSLVIKKEGASVKFDQTALMSSIKRAVNLGNEGVIKRLDSYNKTQSPIERKVILKEIKGIISDDLNN